MVGGYGRKARSVKALLFIFLYRKRGKKMDKLGYILLADDNEDDLELETRALAQYRLANEIVIVRDGAEALDFLYRHGAFSNRSPAAPLVVMLVIIMSTINGLE